MATDHRQHLGRLGEQLAAEHFARLGYDVLARNHRTRWGELDLVLSDGRTLVFCEVKTRRLGSGEPWEALHAAKQVQVRRMAAAWLAEPSDRPWHDDLRFDAVGVLLDRFDGLVRLDHVQGAF
ncbi:MAG: YraN family protein [Solirubrobacteraceae bacterium]